MRRPRLRSLVLLFALLVWFGAVHWYWKHRLGLVPVDVIRFDDGWSTIRANSFYSMNGRPDSVNLLDNGNLVLSKWNTVNGHPRSFHFESRGPIRVWDPVHHRVVHEIEEVQGLIKQAWICGNGTAVVQSQEFVTVVDLNEGRVVLRLPAIEGFEITVSPDARFAVLFDPVALRPTVYDSNTGRPTFVAEMSSDPIEFSGWNTAIVLRHSGSGRQALSTLTWQPVPKPTAAYYSAHYSSGGQFAIDPGGGMGGDGDERSRLIDCIEDRVVASFPRLGEVTACRWDFCREDSELVQIFLPGPDLFNRDGEPPTMREIGETRLQIVRRATTDGRVLSEAMVDTDRVFPASGVSPDGRMFVGYHEAAPLEVPEFVWLKLARFNLDWLLHAPAKYVAIDTESGQVVTSVAPADSQQYLSDFWWHPVADFCDHGFCVATEEQLSYFAYPLKRRWLWLFGWALGPPAALWCMRSLLAYRRRRSELLEDASPSRAGSRGALS